MSMPESMTSALAWLLASASAYPSGASKDVIASHAKTLPSALLAMPMPARMTHRNLLAGTED